MKFGLDGRGYTLSSWELTPPKITMLYESCEKPLVALVNTAAKQPWCFGHLSGTTVIRSFLGNVTQALGIWRWLRSYEVVGLILIQKLSSRKLTRDTRSV